MALRLLLLACPELLAHLSSSSFVFFFNDTATTEIYTLSLHDALPIYRGGWCTRDGPSTTLGRSRPLAPSDKVGRDRKSTRLNSSHGYISYAVFCLKKKKIQSCRSTKRYCTKSSSNAISVLSNHSWSSV